MILEKRKIRGLGTGLIIWLSFLALVSPSSAQTTAPTPPLTRDQVVERMVAMNQRRAEGLRGYGATRVYHLENGQRRAELVVKMTYHWPDRKEFTIISESGSKFLRNHVLKRLVKAELEAMEKQNRQSKEMDSTNYDFQIVGYERTPLREFYVLEVTPKVENKFLFRGKIWVAAQDFAIVRMEGQPAKNPSWWITKTDIQHSYQRIGEFWLPARNETLTQVRIFGTTLLTIDYQNYELIEARSLASEPPAAVISAATPKSKD